jgi:hypothetical protein
VVTQDDQIGLCPKSHLHYSAPLAPEEQHVL